MTPERFAAAKKEAEREVREAEAAVELARAARAALRVGEVGPTHAQEGAALSREAQAGFRLTRALQAAQEATHRHQLGQEHARALQKLDAASRDAARADAEFSEAVLAALDGLLKRRRALEEQLNGPSEALGALPFPVRQALNADAPPLDWSGTISTARQLVDRIGLVLARAEAAASRAAPAVVPNVRRPAEARMG
jgi:hypothetical protein